ncbi:MAG TPA: branched-chain amino acid ABC transporter permease [Candidatus Limnocylindrales bacterium]
MFRLSDAQRRQYRRNPVVLAALWLLGAGLLVLGALAGSVLGFLVGFVALAVAAYWSVDALLVGRVSELRRRTTWNVAFIVVGALLIALPLALGSLEIALATLAGIGFIVLGGGRLAFDLALRRGWIKSYGQLAERATEVAIAVFLWSFRIAVVFVIVAGSALTLASGRYDIATWVRLLVDGLTLGSVYAMIALGYTMVYGILRMINFAHGEVFISGAFGGYFTAVALNNAGLLNASPLTSLLSVAIMMAVAAATSTIIAVIIERVAYRPLRNAPRLVPLISAIGASFFLQYTLRGLFGSRKYSYPAVNILNEDVPIAFLDLRWVQVLVIVTAVIMMAALYLFVMRTKTGTAIRAVSEDKSTAALMGIDVNRAIVTTFALGAALAGVAGVLYALYFRQVDFFSGFVPGVKAFTSAVLGGIGNVPGAMVGGLFLGEIESVGPTLFFVGLGVPSVNQLKDVIAFTMLVLVLIFRPSGILGERLARQRA